MGKAFCITARELAEKGMENLPGEFKPSEHLIYSSPATLAYNSPGAQGFGVKRAGLAIPGSVMLLVSPGCCGRNTSALGGEAFGDRMFYLLMDETDIVTGRHLARIPEAVREVKDACRTPPTAVMICITCVDALLGTDMERVCRDASAGAGVPVLPCYMYALTREGRLPPMSAVRRSVYSLLEPKTRRPDAVNILGYFTPLAEDCELYPLLRGAGVRRIRTISECGSFGEYLNMAEANFDLVLDPGARYAASDLETRLSIPSVELRRMYQTDKISNQYRALGSAIGAELDDSEYRRAADAAVQRLGDRYPDAVFAVGENADADPFELSLALCRRGFGVSEIYGTVTNENFPYIKRLAEVSPDTAVYSNLSPTMLFYDGAGSGADAVIGGDAAYYHPGLPRVLWNSERQPFGHAGVRRLFEELYSALGEGRK